MKPRTEPVLITPDWQVPKAVIAFTSTRLGGVSSGEYSSFNLASHVGDKPADVAHNRKLLRSALKDDVSLQWLDQVHGTNVIEAVGESVIPRADAAFTTKVLTACCIATADCLPVLLTNRSGDMVAAAHAGWRGLAAGILDNVVRKFSCPPGEVIAWLGPAIGPCHFEVGDDVRDAFLQSASAQTESSLNDCFQKASKQGKYLANLYSLTRISLARSGVTNVSGGGSCTYCHSENFFSFRRQGQTGRMVSLIYLRA